VYLIHAVTRWDRDSCNRVLSVWGPGASAWSGEEAQRAAGFPIDSSGRQRVLGFPADSFGPVSRDWLRSLAHLVRCYKGRGLGSQRLLQSGTSQARAD
jgi:hypothetical protein